MQFTNAHCSQAVCTASRNSLLSGLHPASTGWYSSTSAMRRSYDDVMGDHKMLPQYFKDNGYTTLAVGKVFHSGVSDYKERTGDFWDATAPDYKISKELRARGSGYGGTKFYPFPHEGSQIINHYGENFDSGQSLCWGALEREDMPDGKMFDELIADWAVDQLEQDHAKPFFLAVGFVRPHVPYTAPKEYFDLYDLDEIKVPIVPDDEMSDIPLMGKSIAYGTIKTGDHYAVVNLSDDYWREMVYGYLACVSFVDDQLGKVLRALENSKYAENTIVVLWSDHGQNLGEKKHWCKGAIWEQTTRIPFIVSAPGVEAGSVSTQPVSLIDVYPSLADLAGLPLPGYLDGKSIKPQLADPTHPRGPAISSYGEGNTAIRTERWRYIRYEDGSEELYDHHADPDEWINLANDPAHVKTKQRLAKFIPANQHPGLKVQDWYDEFGY